MGGHNASLLSELMTRLPEWIDCSFAISGRIHAGRHSPWKILRSFQSTQWSIPTPFSLSLFIPVTKIKRDAYAHTLQIATIRDKLMVHVCNIRHNLYLSRYLGICNTIFTSIWIFEFINLWNLVEKLVVQNNLSGLDKLILSYILINLVVIIYKYNMDRE